MTTRGRLLVATPALVDDNFDRTVVLVVEHSDAGALGVVLNRPGGAPVEEFFAGWVGLISDPPVLFVGGPVEREAVLAIGSFRDPAAAERAGSTLVVDAVGVLDLSHDPAELAEQVESVRLFSGYAGWGPGQLDAELAADGWLVVDADPDDVRRVDAEALWTDVLARQRDPALRRLALYPPDINLN